MEEEIYIKVLKDGPYLVYDVAEISQKIILTDENKICIAYGADKVFEIFNSPTAICRCGQSSNSPFCDGTHSRCHFDGTETASFEPILNNAVKYEGPRYTLMDNETYCAFARFCDANGSIWNLILKDDDYSLSEAVREANMCPAGRLLVFDENGNLLEQELAKAVSILEDKGLKISGPLWLQGNIRVESAEQKSYEIRNKQTLCRCGESKNKPFCDSTHRHINFKAKYKE